MWATCRWVSMPATITFGSNAPGVTAVEAPVSLTVNPVKVYLPAVNRQ
jgi:hypothetical protein